MEEAVWSESLLCWMGTSVGREGAKGGGQGGEFNLLLRICLELRVATRSMAISQKGRRDSDWSSTRVPSCLSDLATTDEGEQCKKLDQPHLAALVLLVKRSRDWDVGLACPVHFSLPSGQSGNTGGPMQQLPDRVAPRTCRDSCQVGQAWINHLLSMCDSHAPQT